MKIRKLLFMPLVLICIFNCEYFDPYSAAGADNSMLSKIISCYPFDGSLIDIFNPDADIQFSSVMYTEGNVNESVLLNGSDTILFSRPELEGVLAVSFWIKTSDNDQSIFLCSFSDDDSVYLYMGDQGITGDPDRLILYSDTEAFYWNTTTVPLSIDDDLWHHLVLNWSDSRSSYILYFDNINLGPGQKVGTPSSITYISGIGFGVSGYTGIIDELVYWGRSLTDPEIRTLYNNGDGIGYPF